VEIVLLSSLFFCLNDKQAVRRCTLVHAFEMKGKFIAYDSESCALHELDEMAYDVLGEYIKNEGQEPPAARLEELSSAKKYDLKEVLECRTDINALIRTGGLFTPTHEVPFSSLYPEAPVIKALCLHICHDCNLRCRYCFAGTGDFGTGKRSMLDLETGKNAIDFLIAASGRRHHLDVDFFGGEPLMNWQVVVDLTYYCEMRNKESGKDIRLTITTNALLLDDEKTEFINRHMKNCVLSIDGRPEVHDYMRPGIGGKGSYDVVSRRIKTFLEARTSADSKYSEHYVRGTYTRFNLDFSKDVMHMADELGARQISVEPVVAEEDSGYEIRMEDLGQIEKEYEDLAEYILKTRKTDDPVHFFHFIMDMKGGPCVYKRLKGCGVGAEYCAVTPDGDIYPCHQFAGEIQYRMGNVHDFPALLDQEGHLLPGKNAGDILIPEVRGIFIDRLMPKKKNCLACFARYTCGGGCAANSFHATGSLDGTYEVGCRLAQKRLECSLWLAAAGQDA